MFTFGIKDFIMVKKNFFLSLLHKNEVENKQTNKQTNKQKTGKLMKFIIIETSKYVNFFI